MALDVTQRQYIARVVASSDLIALQQPANVVLVFVVVPAPKPDKTRDVVVDFIVVIAGENWLYNYLSMSSASAT